MKKLTSFTAWILILSVLLSLLPLQIAATNTGSDEIFLEEELPEEKTETKAVSVSSISVPAYSGGTSSSWMTYDGGLGMALGDTGAESKMRIVTGTTSSQYSTYRDLLKSKGYTVLYSKSVPAKTDGTNNRHYKFLSPDGTYVVYTYWTPATSQVRIIVDTHVDTLRKFTYTSPDRTDGNGRTEVYMYSLTASTDGFKNTSTYATENRSNSGSMFIVKMPDNSLFVVDGGTYYQMSDRACEQLYDFLRSITGVPEGEKMIINTWHVSHLHFDHCAGFPRFLHKYNTEFELLNIMYNFDIEGASQKYVRRVARLFPNAQYYKQHTGESFNIAGVQFDVLYTVEDRYTPNSSNKLILNDSGCLGSYTEENNGSTVLRMTFDGKTMLLCGDIEKADAVLMNMYPATALKSDLLQIPHHAFDNHTTLVKTVAPTISFINQAESAVRNRKDVYNNNAAWKSYAGTIYFCGEKTVGYAADAGIFYNKVFDTVDFINWSARTYELEEENAFTSTPVADPEAYYRYSRVTTLTSAENTYVIVDDKLDQPLFYDAVTGTVGSAVPAFHASNDEFYFADSQRRGVNWLISYTTSGSLSEQATSGTTYSGTVPIYKGTGGYWGTPTKGRYLAVANGDTYANTGMFGSWTAFSNMMETATKPILIDLLSGGYFLIYRYGYTSGKYYPVYREGNNATGWGSGKLDKSVVTGNLHYFKHRMYVYHDTADTMLLSWTGHKDYYAYVGTPQDDLIGLLSGDLRVTYSFQNSAGTGEIFYDGWQGQKAGTYWLEFTKTYKANTPGDYPVSIKYKNASGTVLELGTFTVHVKDPANDPDSKALFFDFNDDTEARLRYKNQSQYAEVNFDGTNRWQFIEYHGTNKVNDVTKGMVDPKSGTLKIYSKTNDAVRRNLSIRTYALDTTPLAYNPKDAEVIQIRFKMDNMQSAAGLEAYFRLWYYKNNGSADEYFAEKPYYFGENFVFDGNYMTLTIDLYTAEEIAANSGVEGFATQTFQSCLSITGLRPAFLNIAPIDPSKPSSVTIDYLYIGPRADAPEDEGLNYLFFDYTDTEEDRLRYSHERYNGINFDRQDNPFWATSETNTEVQVYDERVIDNKEGVIKVAVAESNAAGTNNANLGPWIATTGVPGVFVERANKTFHGLGYEPNATDYVQVRFKLDGCVRAGEDIATDIVLIYDRTIDGTCGRGTYDIVVPYEFKNGEYIVANLPLTTEFTTADCISTIGFRFRGIKSETKGSGTLTLDYIYVGPEGTLPPSAYTVTFLNADGSKLEEQRVADGGSASYGGATPTKGYDATNHYTFAGWVDSAGKVADLTNITADLTVYASYKAQVHSYTERIVTASDCIHAGQKELSCDCGYKKTEALPLGDHSPVAVPAVAPTCTAAGKTEGTCCSVCNVVIQAQSDVPATGHSYSSKVTTAENCTNSGVKTYTCANCNHSYTEAIAATGHSYTSKVTTAPTCTDTGVKIFTCSKCGSSYTEAISAMGHTVVIDAAVAPTCLASGLTEGKHCSVCNVVLVAQDFVARLGHDYGNYVNNGDTHTATCSRCDKAQTSAHSYTDGICICGSKEIMPPVLDESIQIFHTLDLASDISVTFAVAKTALESYDNYYLECVLPEYNGNALVGTSTVNVQPVANGNYYYFTLTGITAVRMGDMVDAVLRMTKGEQEYYSKTDRYSVATYAYGMLNNSKDAKMLTLCADLLRYGAEAQTFKKYRTDSLVDANMTDLHRSYLSNTETLSFMATDSSLEDLGNPVITWVGKTLDLGSKVGVKFVFSTKNYSGNIANLSMKVTYHGANGEEKTVVLAGAEAYSAENKQYSFTFYGLLASELRTVVDVAIYNGEIQLSETLRYSAESYATKTGGTILEALTCALFAYSDSAKAYFTK